MEKEQTYLVLEKKLEGTLKMNPGISLLTLSCELVNDLKSSFSYMDWVGFYYADEEKEALMLGPYIGSDACERIPFDKGVCGKAYRERKTQLVRDVSSLSYHIACSSKTKTEIVVPLVKENACLCVLDIDSDTFSTLDEIDRKYLEEIMSLLSNHKG